MSSIRRRRAVLAVIVVLLTATTATHLVLRHDLADARATDARLAARLDDVSETIDSLEGERIRIRVTDDIVTRQLADARGRLESASEDEAEERAWLEERSGQRATVEEALGTAEAELSEAGEESEQNQALLASLDRCLDGATRAANALSVGDTDRGLGSIADVRSSCARVGVVIGP